MLSCLPSCNRLSLNASSVAAQGPHLWSCPKTAQRWGLSQASQSSYDTPSPPTLEADEITPTVQMSNLRPEVALNCSVHMQGEPGREFRPSGLNYRKLFWLAFHCLILTLTCTRWPCDSSEPWAPGKPYFTEGDPGSDTVLA